MITGILLVGGKSSRMGTDKSELIYHNGETEKSRLYQILNESCDQTYLSHRTEQDLNSDLPTITDPGDGPLVAIAKAATTFLESALLVLACDTPLLTSKEIDHLIQQRDPSVMATCYSSAIDNKPEPLCAIYEPAFFQIILKAIANGEHCPRRLLQNHPIKTITLTNPQALLNANSSAEKIEVTSIINQTRTMKTIELKYFAQLREIAKKDSESVQTESCTPAGLFEELKQKYQFPHKQKQLMVAVNEEFSDWDYILKEGDELVFIPPVAGG